MVFSRGIGVFFPLINLNKSKFINEFISVVKENL